MIYKSDADALVKRSIGNQNLIKHMYAVSAILTYLADKFDEDVEVWKLTGLLHDIDFEETKSSPEQHAIRSAEMLKGQLPEYALHAIRAHNYEYTQIMPETILDHALIASDAVSGLIVATALVMPNRKLSEVRCESVLKKFDDSSFAKNIARERILHCKHLQMSKEEFIAIGLKALQGINDRLGL
jgi:putative nucleotidyltransferase with HDIG domain